MRAAWWGLRALWEYNFIRVAFKLLRERHTYFSVLLLVLRTAPPDVIELLGWVALWGWGVFLVSPAAANDFSEMALFALSGVMPLWAWAIVAFQIGTMQLYFLLSDSWLGRRVASICSLAMWLVLMVMSFGAPYPPPVTVMFVVAVMCALWLYWRLGHYEPGVEDGVG
jgi:hypothetical protein